MPSRFPVLITLLAAIGGSFPAWADIYSYQDENGVINFTNVRPNNTQYKIHIAYKDRRPTVRPLASLDLSKDYNPITLPARLDAIVNQAANNYGTITSVAPGRNVQLGLRLTF